MSSNVENSRQIKELWPAAVPYVVPPFAAGAAIILVFYGFMAKSAQQLGKAVPRMPVTQALTEGCKAAPTIGVVVGTQVVVQDIVEKLLKKGFKEQSSEFASMLASSVIVGAASVPGLAVFNGQTLGRGVMESLKSLSFSQSAAIVSRETSFLFSLRISDPLSEIMKQKLGDNFVADYGSAFMSGAIGSLVGHPADTALTLWQNGMKVGRVTQLMSGALIKALTVGSFSVFYKKAKECMTSFAHKKWDS